MTDPTRALRRILVWEPDLEPDERYVPLVDLDLADLARAVCRRLGDAPARVGWSAVVMGVASRFWSVSVVPYAADGVLVDPGCLVARHDDGAVTLGVHEPRGRTDATDDDLDAAVRSVLEPLVDAVPLAPRLLWGNAAASLHAVPRVHHLPRARPVVDRLLAGPGFAGELDVRPDGTARRRTCCLFYLASNAGLCGDCVFDVVPARP
ncbi:(2Fe-2S)-binding protein [Nocardioides sp. C4-1]|uniref:(2Fe-2S)-binding protein n=1 Tax=Nocardioides sp. C4-1 TaxID=3151851 RepID=UPI003264EE6C